MKKVGKIFIALGLILSIVFTFIGAVFFINAFQYISAVVGLVMIFLGISFLFFEQDYNKRKTTTLIIFIISLVLFGITYISSLLHLPGTNIELNLSIIIFGFTCLPLVVRNRYEKWVNYTPHKFHALILALTDFICVLALVLSYLFGKMHWPGAKVLLIFGGIMFFVTLIAWNNTFKSEVRKRKEAEDRVKEALNELKEKNTEIVDSINYAKRIQEAILPPQKLIETYFEDAFVLFKPKDIVAGDFYWAQKIGNNIFFAVADCTGHGVPGAIVSVVCSNALNRSVKEFGLIEPGKILDKTRELVMETFEKSDTDVKDGMDISLIAYDKIANIVLWSGANNPLWYWSNESLKEIKADKQPVGKHFDLRPFTTHKLDNIKGDVLYLFTDGFADQFGGPRGKKYKYKQLEEKIAKNVNLPLQKQKEILDSEFENWRGKIDQIDDVCVVGIKIN